MIYDVVIIGGGASGVAAAIFLSRAGVKTLLIEQEKELLKKVKKTGNGRCNFTNSYYDDNVYRGASELAKSGLDAFDYKATIEFMESIGVAVRDVDGYYYPYTNRADTVVNAMINAISSSVDVILDRIVLKVCEENDHYHVVTSYKEFDAKRVIVATGGKAGYFFKNNDEQGYSLLRNMGHSVTALKPALCELYTVMLGKTADYSGIRVRGSVSIIRNGEKVSPTEHGELQLTKNGISGIPVFQISRYAGVSDSIAVNLMPYDTVDEVIAFLDKCVHEAKRSVYSMLLGLWDERLVKNLIDDDTLKCRYDELSYDAKRELINKFSFEDKITGIADYDKAQVTVGGVKGSEIDAGSFKSKLNDHLYVIGEVLDVDGTCGGYNLQFAFASAYVASRAIIKELRDDQDQRA